MKWVKIGIKSFIVIVFCIVMYVMLKAKSEGKIIYLKPYQPLLYESRKSQ